MSPKIQDFSNIVGQLEQMNRLDDQGIKVRKDDRLKIMEPVKAPSGWTKFKAAISHLPLLGGLSSLRKAREEVESYPIRLEKYEISNRQAMGGFMQALRDEFGEDITDMAMPDVDMSGTTPLTGRTVKTVLEQARPVQESRKSINRMAIMRFLECALANPGHLPGGKDMVGLFLDRHIDLQGHGNWQGAVGEKAASFIEHYVRARCTEMKTYGQSMMSNQEIQQAANEALDLYQELLAVPGMTQENLGSILERAGEKRSSTSMKQSMREFAIVDKLEILLNRRDPQSMLCKTAERLALEHNLPLPPDTVLKSISNSITETLSYRTSEMPEQLGCGEDISSILEALGPALEGKVTEALNEHFKALEMIEDSTTLTTPQKEILRNIANTRRIDTTQVLEYENTAKAMQQGIQTISEGLPNDNFEAIINSLDRFLDAFVNGFENMKKKGESLWDSMSLAGSETPLQVLNQSLQLATADLTEIQARELLTMLTSKKGHELVQGLQQSSNLRMAGQLSITYGDLVRCVAARAGVTEEEATAMVRQLTKEIPKYDLPTTLLNVTAGMETDERGVVSGCGHDHLVKEDFQPDQILEQYGTEILDHVGKGELHPGTNLSKTFNDDLGRATFYLEGILVAPDEEIDKTLVSQQLRQRFPEGEKGDLAAQAVSRCMSQLGIDHFSDLVQSQAFGTMVLTDKQHSSHEVWQGDNGDWFVRSIHTARPSGLVEQDGQQQNVNEIETDGMMMFSLTYRISGESIEQGKPQIEIQSSKVVFDF